MTSPDKPQAPRQGPIQSALDLALIGGCQEPRDGALVAVARRLAMLLDSRTHAGAADATSLGVYREFRATLEALQMTPSARREVLKGGEQSAESNVSPLAALRARREGLSCPQAVDAAPKGSRRAGG